jgi:hypothetical protein
MAELATWEWDTSGNVVSDPLDESTAIDLGADNVVAVTITVISTSFTGTLTQVGFKFMTAPINQRSYYATKKAGGSDVEISVTTVTAPTARFETTEGLSRFLLLAAVPNGTSSGGNSKMVATIDVVVRG